MENKKDNQEKLEKIQSRLFEVVVKAIIINDENEVLILKRKKGEIRYSGKYDLPGGSLEAGEKLEDGLCREIEEEIGIEIEPMAIIHAYDFKKEYSLGKEGKITVPCIGIKCLSKYIDGAVKLSDEHENYEWMKLDEAIKKLKGDCCEEGYWEALGEVKKYLMYKNSLDGWKRCQADFENYKKRQMENQKEAIKYANADLILEILPVIDNFQASIEHIPAEQKDDPWVVGIMHIQRQLENVLNSHGVTEIPVKPGDKLDTSIMEALENKECKPDDCKNVVKKVMMRGYRMGERVIRAAKVIVE